jgi:hypothetical protein
LGNSVANIGEGAFSRCPRLESVCCRGNAPSLEGHSVFKGSPATIYYLNGATGWKPILGGRPTVLWNPPVPFSYSIGDDAITITDYTGPSGDVTIPYSINFLPVIRVDERAFWYRNNITSVAFPDSLNSIGDMAFIGCTSLTNILIPYSVTNIGNAAFAGDSSLTGIMVDGENAWYSSVDGVLYTRNKKMLVEFPAGKMGSYVIPNGVIVIGESAFSDCNRLTNIAIAASVTSIEDAAFAGCNGFTNITFPNGVTNIGNGAFSGCLSLISVTFGTNVAYIGSWAFASCSSLNGVQIPNKVVDIGMHAFDSCLSLTEVTIPSSVTSIEDRLFLGAQH